MCAGEDDGLLAVLDKVFTEQAGLRLLSANGRLAFLSLATYMHLKDFATFSKNLLQGSRLTSLVHLGNKNLSYIDTESGDEFFAECKEIGATRLIP